MQIFFKRLDVSRAAYAIRRIFMTKRSKLIWPAYQTYVLSVVSYCSSIWSSVFNYDAAL